MIIEGATAGHVPMYPALVGSTPHPPPPPPPMNIAYIYSLCPRDVLERLTTMGPPDPSPPPGPVPPSWTQIS